MHNLSISDLNSIQFDEKFTGQLLVNVENGRIVRNYHLPDGVRAGGITCDAGILCAVSALLPRLNGWWCTLRPERPAVRRGDTTGTAGGRNAAGGAE